MFIDMLPEYKYPNSPYLDNSLTVSFRKMTPDAILPSAKRDGDIGFDICANEDVVLWHGTTRKVSTGIQLADMPTVDNRGNKIFLKVEGRSGLAASGVFPVGGIVDPTYRGEIGIILTVNNLEIDGPITINKGDRIAQLVVYKVATAGEVVIEESEDVTETVRGDAGFGSSGVK